MIVGTLLHFILKTLNNKTYSHCQVNIHNVYKHVHGRSCGLNWLDGTMPDLQRSYAQCISCRPVIMASSLYLFMVQFQQILEIVIVHLTHTVDRASADNKVNKLGLKLLNLC